MLKEVKKQHIGSVEKFLNSYPNPHTKNNYYAALHDFFRVIFGKHNLEASQEELKWVRMQGDEYFSEDRDCEKDLESFVVAFNGRPPKTIKLKLAAVKMFLLENDVELPQKFWRKVRRRIKGSRALTLDRVPTNEELRQIMMHLPVHGKALYLMLESSGMRIGEALQLKLDDVNLDKAPVWIELRGEYTKTGNPRIAFASSETKEALNEWVKVREEYIESAVGKSHLYQKQEAKDDNRVFPFEKPTAYSMWNNALKKAKMNEKDRSTNRLKLHPHVLRKFFRTRLGSVIPVDVVEALMGHEGYLTEIYRRYSPKELAKFYLEGEQALMVFGRTIGDEELQQDVNLLFRENRDLRKQNLNLKQRIQRTEEKLDLLEKGLLELKQKSNS